MFGDPIHAMKITHIPSGVSVQTASNVCRTLAKSREVLMQYLKSKIAAENKRVGQSGDIVCSYDLPENDLWPHDLESYRTPIGYLGD